jgi:hypothetical protein
MNAVLKRASLAAAAAAAIAVALPATQASAYTQTMHAMTAVRIHKTSSLSSVTLGIAYPSQKLVWNGLGTTTSYPMLYIRDTATGVSGWVASAYLK